MSEERKNSELNEAELEGVSGGAGWDYAYSDAIFAANAICKPCRKCKHSVDLAKYMLEHGNIGSYNECPYYQAG